MRRAADRRIGSGGRCVVVACLALGLAGCGGGDSSRPPAAEPEPEDTPAGQIASDGVAVFLTEYSIDMPASITAGETAISVTNQGVEDHNLVIRRKGEDAILWETDGNVEPRVTENARIELPPGTYMAACTFAGHDTRGMFMELEVVATERCSGTARVRGGPAATAHVVLHVAGCLAAVWLGSLAGRVLWGAT